MSNPQSPMASHWLDSAFARALSDERREQQGWREDDFYYDEEEDSTCFYDDAVYYDEGDYENNTPIALADTRYPFDASYLHYLSTFRTRGDDNSTPDLLTYDKKEQRVAELSQEANDLMQLLSVANQLVAQQLGIITPSSRGIGSPSLFQLGKQLRGPVGPTQPQHTLPKSPLRPQLNLRTPQPTRPPMST
eukprot:TRINITY_DN48_c0_g1_i4.p1 TRINITY_DN48_c0_g1~~TRINITY_DN48_c0_g1_i4.p1  ORF type:complete len:191 (+),score=38.49 TRINITY_DN48_c0_g1_i4:734-1306(+)